MAGIQAASGTENLTGCRVNFRSGFQGLFNASVQSEYTRPVKGYDGFLRGQLSYFGEGSECIGAVSPVQDAFETTLSGPGLPVAYVGPPAPVR